MNNIDLIGIVPTYVIRAFPSLSQLGVAKLFRIMRVLRIFKLSRHSNGLQVLAKTGMACKHELGLLLFCLLVFSLLFSAVLFFAEEDVGGTGFESIPHTMWWAVVTITTVGYGDLAPETYLGRCVPTSPSFDVFLLFLPLMWLRKCA
jgi:voltage-gated potassium channel